jgi:hypothetical protein
VITERRVLNFKASQLLKQALNDEPSAGSESKDGAGLGGESLFFRAESL